MTLVSRIVEVIQAIGLDIKALYGRSGSATLSFGSTPVAEAIVSVTGQTSLQSGSTIRAWISPDDATVTNGASAHAFAATFLRISPQDVNPGHGFNIYAFAIAGLATGDFTVHWEYR